MISKSIIFIIPIAIICLGASFGYVIATSNQPGVIYQSSPNSAYLPYQSLLINGTNPPSSAPILYGDCTNTISVNCQFWIDRKPNNGGEVIFGCGQKEEFAVFERYHGSLYFAQRTNSTAYAYHMEMLPSGQIVVWSKILTPSYEGHWGYMQGFDNGTVKFIKQNPRFTTQLGC